MQARGITGGITLGTACYWGSKQQYLYFWDELLWICGFFVIENNLIAQRVRLRTGFGSSSAA